MLKIKNTNKILILTILLTSFFSQTSALKIIIGDKVQNNVIIKKTNSKIVNTEKVFETFAQVFASGIPESYRYISLNFKGINENDKIYSYLQRLVYADLLPNSAIKINKNSKFSKKLFYGFANNFAGKKIFELNPEASNKLATQKDLDFLKKEILKQEKKIVKTKSKEEIFEKKVERMYNVFETITKKHYSSEKIDKNKMLNTAIEGLAIGSGDKFTTYFPPQKNKTFQASLMGKYEGIGAYVHMPKPGVLEVIAPLSGTPADLAGIKAKDIFIEINGHKVTKENSLSEVVSWIKGPAGTKAKIKIRRGKEIIDLEVERKKITVQNVTSEKVNKDTFYIKILFFGNDVVKDFKKSLEELKKQKNIKKVIIDLRNNPGGYLDKVAKMLSYFIVKGEKTVVVKEKVGGYSYKSKGYDLIDFSKYRIILLQNKGTASASEIMIGTIKDYYPKATIIGETSYGKGSVQTIKTYKDGSSLKYTIAKWFTGKNENGIDGKGIKPDIELKDDSKNSFVKTKKLDKVLERAKSLK